MKIDKTKLYVAVDGFITSRPRPHTHVPQGKRLRGDDPVVQANSIFFVEDGATDEEHAANRRARTKAPVHHETRRERVARERAESEVRLRVATESFTASGRSQAGENVMFQVTEGDRFPADHQLVKNNQKRFRKLRDDERKWSS